MNGTSTLLVQADSARVCSRNGIETSVEGHHVGDRPAQDARGPAQLALGHQRRAWRMKGSAASSVSSEERTPGSASSAKARSDGSAMLSEAERRASGPQRVAQRRDRGGQRHVLAREGARGDVEVRHEVLQRQLVIGERRERPAAPSSTR